MSEGLSPERKLVILCRVEPGCLGPMGMDYIEEFCQYANGALGSVYAEFITWQLVPRYDKSLPETEYAIANKKLTHEQAGTYLYKFGKELDEMEEKLHEVIAHLVEKHMGE